MIPDVHQVPFVYLPRGAYCSATGTTPCEKKVLLLYLHAKAVRTSRRKKLAAEMRERITSYGRDLVKEILSRKFSIKGLTVYNNNPCTFDRRRKFFLCLLFLLRGLWGAVKQRTSFLRTGNYDGDTNDEVKRRQQRWR